MGIKRPSTHSADPIIYHFVPLVTLFYVKNIVFLLYYDILKALRLDLRRADGAMPI